jgi:shikimate kinase
MTEPRSSRTIENIALIGFMGTGKSSVANSLASLLKFRVLDTDALVEKRAGKRISEVFHQDGEPRFRQHEREVVADLLQCRGTIIATGGGLVLDPANLTSLKSHSLVVCLWASPETIWERVRHQSHRPLLEDSDPLAKIRRLLAERDPLYRQADVLINTELRSVREVASQVAHQFRLIRQQNQRESRPSSPGA